MIISPYLRVILLTDEIPANLQYKKKIMFNLTYSQFENKKKEKKKEKDFLVCFLEFFDAFCNAFGFVFQGILVLVKHFDFFFLGQKTPGHAMIHAITHWNTPPSQKPINLIGHTIYCRTAIYIYRLSNRLVYEKHRRRTLL